MSAKRLRSFSAKCRSIGCDKCCFYEERKGAPVPKEEADLIGLDVVEFENGRTFLEQKETDRGVCCEHLQPGGCDVWGIRPFVCRYWPAMLYRGDVVLSLKCPYVVNVLLPRIDEQGGFTEDDVELFSNLRAAMREEIPKDLEEWWNDDISKWPVVLMIKV